MEKVTNREALGAISKNSSHFLDVGLFKLTMTGCPEPVHNENQYGQKLNVINLTHIEISMEITNLLQLGLSSCPDQVLDKLNAIKGLNLFVR